MENEFEGPTAIVMSDRERELTEKLGSRLLLVWLVGLIAVVELLVIVHIAR
jgi:hypothetical protein